MSKGKLSVKFPRELNANEDHSQSSNFKSVFFPQIVSVAIKIIGAINIEQIFITEDYLGQDIALPYRSFAPSVFAQNEVCERSLLVKELRPSYLQIVLGVYFDLECATSLSDFSSRHSLSILSFNLAFLAWHLVPKGQEDQPTLQPNTLTNEI